ncbi:MAG: hypothetical protein PVJ28_07240 [Acidimicrobiia bacterium]
MSCPAGRARISTAIVTPGDIPVLDERPGAPSSCVLARNDLGSPKEQSNPPNRTPAESGVSSVQFVLAAALALILFLALANLVVVQYGRGAVRSALEQGSRAGSVGGVAACELTAHRVVEDLLGGRMSDSLFLWCAVEGGDVSATARGKFQSWTPFTPDFDVSLTSRAVAEP